MTGSTGAVPKSVGSSLVEEGAACAVHGRSGKAV